MVDEEVHWGMPWLIPPLRGRALLFRPGAEGGNSLETQGGSFQEDGNWVIIS